MVQWIPTLFDYSTYHSKKGIQVQEVQIKTSIVETTKRYLAARHFTRHAQCEFSDLFHSQHSSASLAERISSAHQLARIEGVPLDVLSLLCCDDYRVASPILTHSPMLSATDLTTQILQGTLAVRQAIANRIDLNSVLISHLLSFAEKPVAQALLRNRDNLPHISEKLFGRMERLGEAKVQKTRHRVMTKDKGNLDALVSSMEEDWYAHYQPETLATKEASKIDGLPVEEHALDTPIATDAPQADEQSFLVPEEIALLEKLGGSDWEQLDDEAIEALAGSLAMDNALEALAGSLAEEDVKQLEAMSDAEKGNNAGSFTIGADDVENARIPPLEVHDPHTRQATISFRGQSEDPVDALIEAIPSADVKKNPTVSISMTKSASAQTKDVHVATPSIQLSAAKPSDPAEAIVTVKQDDPTKNLQAAMRRPLNATETSVLSETMDNAAQASVTTTNMPNVPSSKNEERKPQIKLTVRKRSAETSSEQGTEQPTAPAYAPAVPSVQLCSATEDDWHKALDRLNSDFDPKSAERATTGFSETIQGQKAERAPTISISRTEPVEPTRSLPSTEFTKPEPAQSEAVATAVEAKRPSIRLDAVPLDEIEPVSQTREHTVDAPQLQSGRHAPMGFMPDVVSFDGLDLVEAEPDLPSATELLLEQQNRSTPMVELVEPVELAYIENGKMVAVDDIKSAPMQMVVEQLAAERETLRDTSNKPPEASAPMDIEDLYKAEFAPDHTSDDMTDLPALSKHRVVDVEEYENLKSNAQSQQDEQTLEEVSSAPETVLPAASQTAPEGWHGPVSLLETVNSAASATGVADSFYTYDEETRLTLLQAIVADALVDRAQQNHNANQRVLLDNELAQDLVMARFGNDRIHVADMMHEISGHRRLDMTRLLQDSGGEALVVYLYHIGLDEGSTLSILLHGPDAVSHSYAKVEQLMTLYHQLYPVAAAKIVEQLFGSGKSAKAVHKPLHDDGSGLASPRLRGVVQAETQRQSTHTLPDFGRRKSAPD